MRAALDDLGLSCRDALGLSGDAEAAIALKAARVSFLSRVERQASSEAWRPGRGRSLASSIAASVDAMTLGCASRSGVFPRAASLLVTGGGGRGELAPYSDLDLLLAFEGAPDEAGKLWASRFMRLLWDSGLVGNLGVRSWDESAKDAGSDPDFLTSLLSGRLLLGDGELAATRIAAILARRRKAAFEPLLAATAEAAGEAVLGEDPSLFAREPDLKNGSGGLRSLHRMEWLGGLSGAEGGRQAWRRHFDAREGRRIETAYDFQLWLRIRLHLRKGREVDRLGHDDLEALSGGGQAGSLIALLYECRRTLALAEQSFREGLAAAQEGTGPLARPRASPGFRLPSFRKGAEKEPATSDRPGRGCAIVGGLLVPATGADFSLAGYLEALLPLAEGRAEASAALLRAGARLARATDGSLRERPAFSAFRELLNARSSQAAFVVLDNCGLLSRLVPPWSRARDLSTSQSFHDLPVGPHSLRALRMADLLLGPERQVARDFSGPLASIAERYLDTAWVAKLALILHDVGKAFVGDHAKNGAELASAFLETLPTEVLFKDMIVDLIENHLLLSSASRGVDSLLPESLADLASEFARRPFPEDTAGLLAVVTCCDIAATNPKAWSGYRASRLESLVMALEGSLHAGQGQAPRTRILAERLLALDAMEGGGSVAAFARRLGDRYILANGPERIARDFALFEANHLSRHDVEVVPSNDHLVVKVFAPDERGLFATIAGILLANGADIVRADIHTLDGVAIDEFVVTEVFGNDLLAEAMSRELSLWIEGLAGSLRHYVLHKGELAVSMLGLEKATRPVPAVFRRKPKAGGSRLGGLYRFELSCTDRPALLYDLAHCLSLAGLDLQGASIETTGWQAHDSFVVSSRTELDDERIAAITAELLGVCAGNGKV